MLTNSAEDRVFYSVQIYPSGEVITGYRDLPAPDFTTGNGGEDRIVQYIDFRGERMRMVAIRDEALSYAAKQTFVVLVAETMGQRQVVLERYLGALYGLCHWGVAGFRLTLYAVNWPAATAQPRPGPRCAASVTCAIHACRPGPAAGR